MKKALIKSQAQLGEFVRGVLKNQADSGRFRGRHELLFETRAMKILTLWLEWFDGQTVI
jgi:hypothetical protein